MTSNYTEQELLQKVEDLMRENNILKELNSHLSGRIVDLTRQLNEEKVRRLIKNNKLTYGDPP